MKEPVEGFKEFCLHVSLCVCVFVFRVSSLQGSGSKDEVPIMTTCKPTKALESPVRTNLSSSGLLGDQRTPGK